MAHQLVGEPVKEPPTIVTSGALEVDVAILWDLRATAPAATGPDLRDGDFESVRRRSGARTNTMQSPVPTLRRTQTKAAHNLRKDFGR